MNLGVDLIGIESVASVIRQSKLPRFFIIRNDAHKSSTPIFEVNDSTNPETAVKRFIEWGNTILVGNPYNDNKYDIILHSKESELSDEDLNSEGVPKRDRVNRVKFSFMLRQPQIGDGRSNPVINGYPMIQHQQQPTAMPDLSNFIHKDEVANMLDSKLQTMRLQMELDRLKEAEKKRLEEDDEDEEDEEEKVPALMNVAMGMLEKLFPAQPPATPTAQVGAAINGNPFNDDELDRIDDAVETMRKVDPEIILHLEKLAKMCQANPDQFKQLLATLDLMVK